METTPSLPPTGISQSRFLKHPNGQITHCVIDDFTDPWKPIPAETILIQHGFARHHNFWYHWIPALTRKYRVIRRDLRGHGLSSAPPLGGDTTGQHYTYGLDTILHEIIDTLDQLLVDKVHFLGESTSGMLGLALAARYPGRLLSLTTCASPSHLPPPALDLFAFGHMDWPTAVLTLGSRGWAVALSKIAGTVGPAGDGGDDGSGGDQAYLDWWVDQVARSTSEGLAGYAGFLAMLDARPFLKDIASKTLILAPSRSAATTLDEQRRVQSQIAGARLVVIDAPGHEIYVQRPRECQHALLEFLDGLERNVQ